MEDRAQEVMCSAGKRIKPAAKDHSGEDLEEATQRRYSLAQKTKCSTEKDSTREKSILCAENKLSSGGTRVL